MNLGKPSRKGSRIRRLAGRAKKKVQTKISEERKKRSLSQAKERKLKRQLRDYDRLQKSKFERAKIRVKYRRKLREEQSRRPMRETIGKTLVKQLKNAFEED